MIRLNKLTDYAIVLLAKMAKQTKILAVTDLAEATSLPAPTIAKILKKLTKAGLARATRGANGGYQLARPVSTISVADIIEAMDGPIAVTDCVSTSAKHPCDYKLTCELKSDWERVNNVIRTALTNMPISDLGAMKMAETMPAVAAGK